MHLIADAAVSEGVVGGGLVLVLTGWAWVDRLVSLIVSATILVGTWSILRESLNLALDPVLPGIDPDAVRAHLDGIGGVLEVHDLHIWPMSTTETALTAHLVMQTESCYPALLRDVDQGAGEALQDPSHDAADRAAGCARRVWAGTARRGVKAVLRFSRMRGRRAVLGSPAALLASALVAIAACSGDENRPSAGNPGDAAARTDDDAASDGGATPATIVVELGTGSASFVPLTNADKIAIVRGKQGLQHLWVSTRVSRPLIREAIVTIATRLADGRPGGPPISVAVLFAPVDDGGGVTEVVGLTGLVDYIVSGKRVTVHVEVATADGQHGADERSVDVLAPIDYRCTADAGGPTCDALCGETHCSTCELGLADVGYINRVDASSAIVTSCTTALDVDAVQVFACCCCR